MNNPQILVLDFGSQYTQLIARRLREYGIYTEIVPYFETLDSIKAKKPKGIILSGGPASVYEEGAYKPDSRIFDLNIPILGICYGMQYIAHFFGGSVVKAEAQEFGRAVLTILNGDSTTYDMESHSTHTNNMESNNIKQITSDTLILREFVSSDLEDVESMLLDSEVMSAWGRALSKQEAKEWLDKQMQSYRKYGFGLFAVVEKSSNEIVGQCGITWQSVQDSNLYDTIKASLSNTDYLNRATQHAMQTLLDSKAPLLPELGYIFKKSHWHKGLASKAAKMCMEYAFKELGLPLLISLIKTDNIAPQNLAKRLEMRIIGKSNKTFDNKDIAHFVYMLKASDYIGLDLNANDSKKVLLEFASYTKNNPMSADTKDELLKIWRDSVHATHHFLKAKDIDEIANDMENLLDSVCLESSLTQNLDSTKRTMKSSAEVSLGNFAGCVDIATRSYLDDNDAVAISNSCKSGKETTQSNKNLESNNKRFKQIISLMQELESLLQYNFIDIEFAFAKPFSQDIKETSNRLDLKQDSIKQKDSTQECTKDSKNKLNDNETLYLLQVRPLVKSNINLFNALPQDALTRLQKRLTSFLKKTPNVLGDRAIFGVMPDWNPAEIIGLRPKRLALSLYKEIVTDNIWAYQRDNYGYKALHSHPLMHSFLGIPYIDVRASFNSFIPKDLDSRIASKLANYYLQRLDSNPQFHDKVEFEIVFSCYDFNTPNSLTTLLNHGFNSNEIKRLEFALLELTNQIINTKNGYYTKDLEKVAKLQDSFTKIKNSDYSLIDKIYWSLQECKRLGTLPFAGIARAGFVAVLMLNSLVSIGFLSEDEKNAFLHTLNTISKQLAESSMNLNAENKAAFLEKFGHLRAGSYDILSPRYDEDFERYFNLDKLHEIAQHTPFSLSTDRLEKLDRILKEHGLKIDSTEFFHFLKIAIEGREYAKFEFSKLLSYTLVLIGELGEHYGISKEDMAHLDIHDILSLYASLYSKSPKQKLLDSISRHKEEYNLTLAIKLPPLITTKEQIFAFQTQQVMPNFITQKSITALKALHTDSNLEGKIVLIYAADPGFDYLFTKNIAGFITCYGGANSHMAIRASEQNMPAVIGVGEEQYQKYCKAERIMIDCQSEQIICL